jgi:hypothetical protein
MEVEVGGSDDFALWKCHSEKVTNTFLLRVRNQGSQEQILRERERGWILGAWK